MMSVFDWAFATGFCVVLWLITELDQLKAPKCEECGRKTWNLESRHRRLVCMRCLSIIPMPTTRKQEEQANETRTALGEHTHSSIGTND